MVDPELFLLFYLLKRYCTFLLISSRLIVFGSLGKSSPESVGTGVKVPDSRTISFAGFSSRQIVLNLFVFRSEFPH